MNRVAMLGLCAVATLPGWAHAAAIEVVDRPNVEERSLNYVSSRRPLSVDPLIRLPLGTVQPAGWVRHQLDLMAGGQIGHLPEISRFLQEDSGWLGGKERGWEEAAYWFRGFHALAVLTGDQRLKKISDRWIEAVISSQDEDGYYGAKYNKLVKGKGKGQAVVDVWPHMVMNDALIGHYEATNDARVIGLLTKFFAFCSDLPDDKFLPAATWDYYENYREHFGDWKPRIQLKRAGDLVPQIVWLYNRTGDKRLIDLAIRVYHKTQPAMNQWLDNHVVHFMQRFRYPAQMFPITGDERYLQKTELFYRSMMDAWGQMPRGVIAADERVRMGKIDPRQGFETCAMVEANKSHLILGRITGDPIYADRVEDMSFNHLPAAHAPDHKSLRYITACNMPASVPGLDFHNSGRHPVFAADWHRCCQHNTAMGWPWFARNMWQASPDNGLVAWLYGPSRVTAKVGARGQPVTVRSETAYPFGDKVVMTIASTKPVAFPLYLRVPGWCTELSVSIDGKARRIAQRAGRYVKIDRTWNDGDKVEIEFGMNVTATQWPRNGSVTIDRGPLSYSVRIKENWIKDPKSQEPWPRWSIEPGSPWNYGLAIDSKGPGRSIEVVERGLVAEQPWTETNAPIVLKVPARRIPEWGTRIRRTVDSVREGPVRSDEPLETIEMIPMGCAHLRMTCLPVVSNRPDARCWKDIPDPDTFMLDRLTH